MSLRKNFIYNIVYQLLMVLLPIITVPYVSRVLGAGGVGDYSYTAAYSQYFILIGMIGISLYGNRQIAYLKGNRERVSKEFWNIYGLQFITTILALIAYIIIFVVINNNNRMLYLAQSILILSTVFDISWFFIGFEDMRSVVVRNTIVKLIGIACIFIFVKHSDDVIIYSLILALSNIIGQIVMWLSLGDKVDFVKPDLKISYTHLRPALALFVSQLAIQIYTLVDRTMLGFMTDVSQVGLYQNSQQTVKIALTLITALGVVMLPRMSALFAEGKIDKLKEMIYKAFGFVNFMAFPMIIGLVSIADSFSAWFYGPSFDGIGILLKVGSVLLLFIGWSNILGIQVMLPMKMEKQFTISVTVGAVVNFVLNLIIIHSLKSLGTTIASVLAEFAVTAVQVYFLREFISVKRALKTTIKPLIGSVIMGVVLFFVVPALPVGVLWTFIEVGIGGAIYVIAMFILKDTFLFEGLNMVKGKFLKR